MRKRGDGWEEWIKSHCTIKQNVEVKCEKKINGMKSKTEKFPNGILHNNKFSIYAELSDTQNMYKYSMSTKQSLKLAESECICISIMRILLCWCILYF